MKKTLLLTLLAFLFFSANSQTVLWSNDASICEDWIVGNAYENGYTQFAQGLDFQCSYDQFFGPNLMYPLASATADNGVLFLNSYEFGNEMTEETWEENTWIQTANPIDLLGFSNVDLRLSTYYPRHPNGDANNNEHCLIEISTDGITWPDVTTHEVGDAPVGTRFEVFPNLYDDESPIFNVTNYVINPSYEVFNLSEVAGQATQIWLRFRWVGSRGTVWSIDDIEIKESYTTDFRISKVWTGDIISFWEFNILPQAENQYARLGAIVHNDGLEDGEVTVEFSIQDYITLSETMFIQAGSFDTLFSDEFYYPTEIGVYGVNYNLPFEGDIQGNYFYKEFVVSETDFGQALSQELFEATIDYDEEVAFGCLYLLEEANGASGIKVLFGESTDVGTLCQAKIYEIGNNVQDLTLAASSQVFTVTQEMLDDAANGIPTYIPFDETGPTQLDGGVTYTAAIHKLSGTDRLYLQCAIGDDDYGSTQYGPFGPGGAVNWYNGFAYTPVLWLVLDPNFVLDEFGCTNSAACNYSPTANIDDGSCLFVGNPCNDFVSSTIFDSINEECTCSGVTFDYGDLSMSDFMNDFEIIYSCSENIAPITFLNLPLNLENYTVQWYHSTQGFADPPYSISNWQNVYSAISGATDLTYTPDYFEGERSFACLVTPEISTGLSPYWANGNISISSGSLDNVIITGNLDVTSLNTYSYLVSDGDFTYDWVAQNGVIISGQGTSIVQVMWLEESPYSLTLNIASPEGCSGEVIVIPTNNNCNLNVIATTQSNYFCPNGSVVLTGSANNPNAQFQWYFNGVIILDANENTYQASEAGQYQVMISIPGCSAISNEIQIEQYDIPSPPVINGNITYNQCGPWYAELSFNDIGFVNYQWSNGLVGNPVLMYESGDYVLAGFLPNGCVVYSEPYTVNLATQEPVSICLVTVYEFSEHNIVVWEPVESESISSYVVYKETNVANSYEQIGTVPYGYDGWFEDYDSNPAVQASRYKLGIVDYCMVESSLSPLHKTIHLTTNLGLNNSVNLIWSHYEGVEFGSYNIYRGGFGEEMTLLATVASNLNSYTDLFPMEYSNYRIEVEGVSCDPVRSIQTSRSNIANYEFVNVVETSEDDVMLYPNPATDMIQLSIPSEYYGSTYRIYDITGREIAQGIVSSSNFQVDISQYSSGGYFLKVNTSNIRFNKL